MSTINQLSTNLQSQVGSESQFAAIFTAEQLKSCTVKNVNDATRTGIITYNRSDANNTSATATFVNQHGTWMIDTLHSISTPTETLLSYCSALKSQDYQTAYDQLSNAAQSQETEAQFAANFNGITPGRSIVSDNTDKNVEAGKNVGSAIIALPTFLSAHPIAMSLAHLPGTRQLERKCPWLAF